MTGDLDGIEVNTVAPPSLGAHQDTIRFCVPIEQFGRLLLNNIGLSGRRPSLGSLVNADEAIIQPGNKIGFNLAGGTHDFAGSIEIATLRNPAAHAGGDGGISLRDAPG